MKVSVSWIRGIIKAGQCSADIMPKGVDTLVEKIGSQLGAVEGVVDLGKKYEGIVVAKVVSARKHPNADKLTVCLVDDGRAVKDVKRNKDNLVGIVCGAPNVKDGMLAAWIPPGQTVPSTFDKEPFVLEAREIRGVLSNGMLASAKELDFSDEHETIVEIDETAKSGTPLAAVYELDDTIIDIENKMFTHRPDCFGMLGIARELAGIQHMVFRSPAWYLGGKTTSHHKSDERLLSVKNQVPNLAPRFMMQVVKNVDVHQSSLRIQSYLARVGVKSINNVVDVTNYLMLETSQPIHAYDYDKVKSLSGGSSAQVVVRQAEKGESLALLGGKKITLSGGELVIATNKVAVGLAGVMGGAATEVDEKTKNIILEVGNFNMNATRKTAMEYGLFTDAATRFTKNQSPWQTDRVLSKAIDFVIHEAGGLPARSVHDLKGRLYRPAEIKVGAEFINTRLGEKLSAKAITRLLENVEFRVKVSGDELRINVPFWRTDIEVPEDIVEEIGRLYGYDHLPAQLPLRDLSPATPNHALALKSSMRIILSAAGANEVLTYSFVPGRLLEQVGQDTKKSYHIRNALNPQLQYYRQTLMPSLLEKIHPNIKAGYDKFVMFEIGTGHYKGTLDKEKLPLELEQLALVGAAQNKSRAPFYAARAQCDNLLSRLGYQRIEYKTPEQSTLHPALSYYQLDRSANIFANGKMVGRIGEFSIAVHQNLKLPNFCSGFEIYLPQLPKPTQAAYRPINRFPALDQDICLRTTAKLSYAELDEFLKKELEKASSEHGYEFGLKPIDIFQRPSDKSYKQTTWRISLWHPERTLTTVEANKLLDKIAKHAAEKIKAKRI